MVMRDQLGELFVPITADTSGLDRSLQQSKSKLQRASASMRDVGKKMTMGVTLPVVGMGAATLKAASDFESSFAGVRKTIDGTEEEFAALESGFRDMAKQIPINVNEINRIGEAAGQLGIKQENILGFTRVMADLGVATNMASDEAATSLARLANITGMPQEEFDRLGSTVVELGNNLATTESEIVDMSLRLAAAGNQVGLSEDQILSLGGAMSSVGIKAEAGGTAMSRVMIQMSEAVDMGGETLEGFANVAGMSSSEFSKAFKQDASQAIVAFTEGLGNMQESGQSVFPVLDELSLSEIRVRDTLLRAAGAGDLFSEALDTGSKAWQENTALTTEAEQRYGTFASQVTIIKNRLQDMAITIGQPLMHALVQAMDAAEPMIAWAEGMAEKFANLTPKMQAIILGVAGLAAAAGPALIALGFMLPALAAIGGAIAVVLSPIGLLVGAVIALGVVIFKNFDAIRDAVGDAVLWITERLGVDLVGTFNRVRDAFTDTFGGAVSLMRAGDFSAAASDMADTARRFLGEDLVDTLHWTRDEVKSAFADVTEFIGRGEFLDALRILATRASDIMGRLGNAIARRLGGEDAGSLGERLAGAVLAAAVRTVEALASFRDSVTGWLDSNDIGGMISGAFTGGEGPSLGDRISGSIESARVRVTSGLESLNAAVTEWREANDPAQQIANAWKGEGGPSIGERISTFITEDVPKIWESLSEIVDGIGNWFAENLDKVIGFAATFVVKWFGKWRTIVTDLIPWALDTLSEFAPQILAKFDEWLPKVVQGGKDFVANLQRDLTGAWETSITALADIWTQLEPRINEAMESVRPGIEEQGKGWLQGYMDSLSNFFSSIMPDFSGNLSESIRRALPSIGQTIRDFIPNATGALEDMLNGIDTSTLMNNFFKGLAEVIRQAIPLIYTALREIGHVFIVVLKELPGVVFAIVWFVIRAIFNTFVAAIKGTFYLVKNAYMDLWEDLWGLAERTVKDAVGDIMKPINRIIDAARKALDWLNKVRNAPKNFIGGVGSGIGGFIGQFNPMAEGGIVTSPTLALIGEKGPEAVVPLSRGNEGGGMGGDVHVTQNFYGDTSPTAQARTQERAMRRLALERGIG